MTTTPPTNAVEPVEPVVPVIHRYTCCHCGGTGLDSYGDVCPHCDGDGNC